MRSTKKSRTARQLALSSLSERLSASLSVFTCGNSVTADDFIQLRRRKTAEGGVMAWAGATPVWAHLRGPNLSFGAAHLRRSLPPTQTFIYPGNGPVYKESLRCLTSRNN